MAEDEPPARPVDDFPDVVGFLAGPAYRLVNAAVVYVAAYAAISVAAVLADSIFLWLLKYALLATFIARALHVSIEGAGGSRHWLVTTLRGCAGFALAISTGFAANAAVEAGLVQLESGRAEKAVQLERLRQRYRRIGINNGCYDPDYAAISPVCRALAQAFKEGERAINAPEPLPSPDGAEAQGRK